MSSQAIIKNKSPWTKLGISLNLKKYLTRQILIEKFCSEKSKQIEMTDFLISKLDGCELFTHFDYHDYIFYVKNGEILLEQHTKNKYFNIKYSSIWQVFENKYNLKYSEIQLFTKITLKRGLNLKGYEIWGMDNNKFHYLERCLKSKENQTVRDTISSMLNLDRDLKLEV